MKYSFRNDFIFRASGKERALKEIRYLAVLNHPNLIQYYYAWNESPPIGWQEKEDETLLVKNSITTRYNELLFSLYKQFTERFSSKN